jgi:hypothetical protein
MLRIFTLSPTDSSQDASDEICVLLPAPSIPEKLTSSGLLRSAGRINVPQEAGWVLPA